MTAAALDGGSAVLEVGCGTDQLTEQLAPYAFDLTAIDLGPSMISRSPLSPADTEIIATTGLVDTPRAITCSQRMVLPADVAITQRTPEPAR